MGRRPVISGALLGLMGDPGRHSWTLEELHAALGERGMTVDFSSVFRSVTRLESEGVVRRLQLVEGRPQFEIGEEHHDHLSCDSCGALVAVPCGLVDAMLNDVAESTGFALTGHRLLLTGTCAPCRSGQPDAAG